MRINQIIHRVVPAKRVYLDYAAATPLSQSAYRAMRPYLAYHFANPSALHKEGQQAKEAVTAARTAIARLLTVRKEHVTFTSGGTESNNLAIRGVIASLQNSGTDPDGKIMCVTTRAEHPSVLESFRAQQDDSLSVSFAQLTSGGHITHTALREVLTPQTRLVSVSLANSETGVIADTGALARTLREYGREYGTRIFLHVDASQAPLWLSVAPESLGADLLTLDAAKFCGPKGVGILVHRGGVPLTHMHGGGGQEAGLRPGTENVPGIVGTAAALTEASEKRAERVAYTTRVRDYAIKMLIKNEEVILNGNQTQRLPNYVNISLPGYDTEYLAVLLDNAGFAVSTKSACSGAKSGISAVVYEMTGDTARAAATLRLTLSPQTTTRDIDAFVHALHKACALMRPFKDAACKNMSTHDLN